MKKLNHCQVIVSLLLLLLVSCDDKNVVITPNLILDKDEVRLSAYSQSIDVNLKSNVDFEVTSDSEWLTVTKNFAGEQSFITIRVIEYNDTDNDRNGIVNIVPNSSSFVYTLKVVQEAMGIVQVVENNYKLTSDQQKLTITVKHNYDYDVIIPDDAKTWIELDNNKTKTVVESQLTLSIKKNDEYTPRSAQLVISIPSYNETDTICIEQEEGFESLRKIIRANKDCSLFYEALQATGMEDSLINYVDTNYPIIDYEWTRQALIDNYNGIHIYEADYETGSNADRIAYPDQRLFKYTMFLVTDSILSDYNDNYWNGGIHNLEDLREYAKKVYDDPAFIELPDTSRNSPLNKLISYHILPCWLSYDQFNTRQESIIKRRLALKEYDVEDFFETMLPHSVMRISTPYPGGNWQNPLGIFINRKGTQKIGIENEGTRIAQKASEYNLADNLTNICANGGYHYINKILVYDSDTRNNTLQCRMRIMGSTLSPDYVNSGARGRLNGDPSNGGIVNLNKMVYSFKSGFCKNVYWSEGSDIYVRYREASFGYYYGDVLMISGDFDVVFKLPPVPEDATYEIRHMNNSLAGSGRSNRSIVQYYFYEGDDNDNPAEWITWNWEPCGDPVDFGLGGSDEKIGMIADDDDRYCVMTVSEKNQAIYQNDLALRSLGYMKAPDSYTSSLSSDNTGTPIRDDQACWRKIVCNHYFSANKNYYIRIKKVDNRLDSNCPLNFLEIVPKSIYDGPVPEDRH